jgi:signal transduction histidine kinase
MLKKINLIIAIFVTSLLLIVNSVGVNANQKTQSVLFISSYNYDWDSVPYQLEGFNNSIKENVNIDYMFMDTKHSSFANAEIHLLTVISLDSSKYENYDCIVAADDNALDFVMKYRQDKFGNVPVVFLAINNIEKAEAVAKADNVVGIVEKGYYSETIDIAKAIYPNAKSVTAIVDNTNSGIGSKKQLEEAMVNSSLELNFINTSITNKKDIINKIEKLDEKTILIYLNFLEDVDGNNYITKDAINLINEYSKIPAFRTDFPEIKYGLLGGVVIRFDYMGEQAADLVNKILLGEDISDLDTLVCPSTIVFNNDIIKKYNVELPKYIFEYAEILNVDDPFYVTYSNQIIMFIIVLFSGYALWSLLRMKNKNNELAKANNVKLEFLTRMSHDMRTPISAVIGLSDFGIEEKRDDKDVEYFRQIKNSSTYLLALINDILEMQRFEKEIKLFPVVTKQEDIIKDIVSIVRMRAEEKNINFKCEVKDKSFEYHKCDSIRVIQILINILSNAIKYTPENGNVYWKVEYTFENEKHYTVHTIIDNGVGMSKKFIEEIYEPFTQEKNTESFKETGSGLGMSVTKNLVDMMGGIIDVESELTKGSTFILKIPFNIPTQEEIDIFINEKNSCELVEKKYSGKILLCEDTKINAEIVSRILKFYGFTVDVANNGEIGLEKFYNNEYDLILMDIRMPIIGGLELASKIRDINNKIPIIATSANSYPEDIQKSIEAGMNAHLSKPIDKEELIQTIEKLI